MDSMFLDSPIDDIIDEEQWEQDLKYKLTKRYRLGANFVHRMKVRQILANIERSVKKKGPYPLDKARTFIANYETYPEVRSLAEKVLPKIIEGGTINSKRLRTYNVLMKKMREFQH